MMVPHTGHASADRVEMSGSLFFRFAFTVLAIFIVFLSSWNEMITHSVLTISFTYSAMPTTRGLNTYSHSGVCSDSTRPTRSRGFSLDRTWRASSSSSQVEHGDLRRRGAADRRRHGLHARAALRDGDARLAHQPDLRGHQRDPPALHRAHRAAEAPGDYLKGLGKELANSLTDPIKTFGLLRDYAVRKAKQTVPYGRTRSEER